MNALPADAPSSHGFHVMTKPIGPCCNLNCQYCFYLEKEKLFPSNESFRMPDTVLESYIRQYIEAQETPEVTFAWQGGEPTLLGVPFFRKVVELQARHANGKRIINTLQTNGTLLDDEWCAFLATHGFLVGLSVDGPRELHDAYRVDKRRRPTFEAVMHGLDLLKKHGTEFNTLTVVNRLNSQHPSKVYRFLKEIGSGYLQFIPLVERQAEAQAQALGLDLAVPPVIHPADNRVLTAQDTANPKDMVMPWSVQPKQYGEFLVEVFEEWVAHDVGSVFVQLFDVALGNWMGLGSDLCVFAEKCGRAMALEHNGDLFSCDHYVYPRYRLGNILDRQLGDMARSGQQHQFGADKLDTLPRYCRECKVRFACNGECPKHRFLRTPDGEPGLNYLCAGYQRFFNHIDPYLQAMARLLKDGRPAADIMDLIAEHERSAVWQTVGRNDPCPCGSGKKYKQCCERRRQMIQSGKAQRIS